MAGPAAERNPGAERSHEAPVRGGGANLGKLALLLVAIVVAFAVLVNFVLPFLVGFFQGLLGTL